jgi:hypothetical protein
MGKKGLRSSIRARPTGGTLEVVNPAVRARLLGERLAWTLVAPLLALATLAGHQGGYRLAIRDPQARADALAHDGHGYFAYLPIATGALVAIAVLAVACRARGRARGTVSLWAAAVLPPLGFALQEVLERLVHAQAHGGHVLPFAEPAFLTGLALQLPFAVLALLLARKLQRLADTIAARTLPPRRWALLPERPCPEVPSLPRPRPLALARSVRGPPSRSR